MPTVSKQHYHHQFCPLIACTLVSLPLQLMLQLTESHSQYSITQGSLNMHFFHLIVLPLFVSQISGSFIHFLTLPCFLLICRACPSEFVINFSRYRKSVYGTQLSVGMRFGMMFETEESGKRR